MKRTSRLVRSISESIVLDLMGESGPVLEDDPEETGKKTFDSDSVDWKKYPAVIVLVSKKDGSDCLEHTPVGGIQNFDFMNYKSSDTLWDVDDAGKNDKEYQKLRDEESNSKTSMLNKWYSDPENKKRYDQLKKKLGSKFVGADIIVNKTAIKNDREEDDQNQNQNQN